MDYDWWMLLLLLWLLLQLLLLLHHTSFAAVAADFAVAKVFQILGVAQNALRGSDTSLAQNHFFSIKKLC